MDSKNGKKAKGQNRTILWKNVISRKAKGPRKIAFKHSNGQVYPMAKKPEPVAFGQIFVTKGNPSRGKGFEISHFIRRNGSIRSLSRLDVFLPSIRQAADWVQRYYPAAKLVALRDDHFGHLAGLSFECRLSELLPGSRSAKRGSMLLASGTRRNVQTEANAPMATMAERPGKPGAHSG